MIAAGHQADGPVNMSRMLMTDFGAAFVGGGREVARNMSKRYTPGFKRDAVELVRSSGRTPTEVARELGVSPEGLRG